MSYPPPPQPQYNQPAANGKPKLRGRTPLRLSIIFGVIGIALIVVGAILVGRKFSSVDGFKRVTIGQTGSVQLSGTGKWVGYYEASDVSSDIDRIPNIRVAVTGPSGQNVDISPYRGKNKDGKIDKVTYDYNGHKGAAAFQFNAPAKGRYQIQSQAEESLPSGANFAFGRDLIDKSSVGGGIAVGIGIVLVIVAIILLIIGLVKRSRNKRELAQAGSYGGYGGGYPPPRRLPPAGQLPAAGRPVPGLVPPAGQLPPAGLPPAGRQPVTRNLVNELDRGRAPARSSYRHEPIAARGSQDPRRRRCR